MLSFQANSLASASRLLHAALMEKLSSAYHYRILPRAQVSKVFAFRPPQKLLPVNNLVLTLGTVKVMEHQRVTHDRWIIGWIPKCLFSACCENLLAENSPSWLALYLVADNLAAPILDAYAQNDMRGTQSLSQSVIECPRSPEMCRDVNAVYTRHNSQWSTAPRLTHTRPQNAWGENREGAWAATFHLPRAFLANSFQQCQKGHKKMKVMEQKFFLESLTYFIEWRR